MRSSDTAQIFFEDVRVPSKNLIGEEGMGFTYQMLQFQEERLWGVATGKSSVVLQGSGRDTWVALTAWLTALSFYCKLWPLFLKCHSIATDNLPFLHENLKQKENILWGRGSQRLLLLFFSLFSVHSADKKKQHHVMSAINIVQRLSKHKHEIRLWLFL